jgi:hypothetical protein
MRCDLCRDGCGLLVSGDWSAHYGQVEVTFEVDLPARLRRG